MKNTEKTMDKIVALCKNRGFVFPGSEIYGGLANTWDYGPLGAELKKNIKNAWWKKFVQENPYNVGLDAAILMNPQTWVASGHLGGFSDPLMDCRECHERFRADKVIEDWCAETGFELSKPIDAFSQQEMKDFIEEVFVSEKLDSEKPNRKIFDAALRSLGVENREHVLMVGDSLTSDIQGGINAGLDTCWYNPNHAENPGKVCPTYEISNLEELYALVMEPEELANVGVKNRRHQL